MYIKLWDKHLVSVICFLLTIITWSCWELCSGNIYTVPGTEQRPGVRTGAMFITVTSVPGYLGQIGFWVWTVRVVSE